MLGRAYERALHAGAIVSALILGVVALLVTGDVVARNLGLGTLPWIIEATEYSLPLATFLIAPWLLYRGQHVRLDIVLTVLPPRAGGALERIADVIGVAISTVCVVYGVKTIASSAQQGSMVIKAVVFPEWWLYAPVPPCFALLAIEFVRRMLGPVPFSGTGPQA
jgi:TRAP-type C4-dicarboxylate transport system permease small subunit